MINVVNRKNSWISEWSLDHNSCLLAISVQDDLLNLCVYTVWVSLKCSSDAALQTSHRKQF